MVVVAKRGGTGRCWARAVAVIACGLLVLAPQAMAKKGKGKTGFGPVVTRTASVTATAINQHVEATATCPKGRKTVGGGYSASAGPGGAVLLVYRSVMSGQRGWNAAATSTANSPNVLTATVYCRRVKGKIADATATATTQSADLSAATADAKCPGKKSLLGGGFASDVGSNPDQVLIVSASRRSGSTWSASATNGTPHARILTSHAYCLKGVKPPVTVEQTGTQSVPGFSEFSVLSPTCPKARRLSGGGFAGSPFTAPPAQAQVLRGSLVVGSSWMATSRNFFNSTATASLTTQAICL